MFRSLFGPSLGYLMKLLEKKCKSVKDNIHVFCENSGYKSFIIVIILSDVVIVTLVLCVL